MTWIRLDSSAAALHIPGMAATLDAILDLIEPVLDHEGADFNAAVARAAKGLRDSGMVARPASDRNVVVAGLVAYASLARSQGYEAEGLREEVEGPLRALLGEERADNLLAQWEAAGRKARQSS